MPRFFFSIAIVALILGVLWHFGYRVGSLPGDIVWTKGQTKVLIPIASCLLVSVLVSVTGFILRRF